MIITATGHRPERLGGYGEAAFRGLVTFAKQHIKSIGDPITHFNIGMAQGWDQAVGVACHELGIPYRAFVPHTDYDERWPMQVRFRYASLLDNALDVTTLASSYRDGILNDRNIAMLDADTDKVLALYSGTPGGTQHTVENALQRKIPVENLWPKWKRLYAD